MLINLLGMKGLKTSNIAVALLIKSHVLFKVIVPMFPLKAHQHCSLLAQTHRSCGSFSEIVHVVFE